MHKLIIALLVIVMLLTACGDVIQASDPAPKPPDTMAEKVEIETEPAVAPKPYDPWLQKADG